ncbi:MAG: hypothetical protein ACK5FE_13175 [Cyanobacteriota bacterium]
MHEPEAAAITGSITSSLVLAADDPAALAQFYGALLAAQPQPAKDGAGKKEIPPHARGCVPRFG